MDVDSAFRAIQQTCAIDAGRFYGSPKGLPLGAGLLYLNIPYPVLSREQEVYGTRSGPVYVLTHECDADQNNFRLFNDRVLICPIIDLRVFVDIYGRALASGALQSFLSELGRRSVYRVSYIPHHPPQLPYGGLLYLNAISNTAPSVFREAPFATVTHYGLRVIDQALQNLLLRPKVVPLPLDWS